MSAEAISWDDWSVSNPPRIAEDEKWHVQLGPDEVKVVSLEQLDDLFRLSIVDSETQVWQSGMSEWQPLRVIAGLEEAPPPQPRRAPPKPPTRAASPSVRPPMPAPRPDSSSVRPPMPARAPIPAQLGTTLPLPTYVAPVAARPAQVAPASFYPEAVAAPSAYPAASYAEPIAFAQTVKAMNSVRPLVVSQPPPMTRSGGGGFGRFLVGLALVAGVSITAYRNDFVRDGAHAAHQDALYARLESALGGPAFGTVRALEQNATALPSVESSSADAPIRTSVAAESKVTEPSPLPASTGNPQTLAAAAPPVVSVESLAHENKAPSAAKTHAEAAPIAATPAAPARAAASFAQAKPAVASSKATPARAAAPPKAVVEKPAPQKPASEMSERERLNAAIGQSMMQSAAPKAKGKAKAKGNEYDPLNPTL